MNEALNPRVLVVAPGPRGRGGIDSVVGLYKGSDLWNEMNCRMLATYNDKSLTRKLLAALRCYLHAPAALMGVDIVHIHMAGENSLLRKLPILLLAKLSRKRVIVHIHAFSEESLFMKTPRWAWEYSLRAADRVIALSPSWATIIRRHAAYAEVVVVPNPVKVFAPASGKRHSLLRVLFVGKLEVRKGYDTLLAAAAIVLKEFPEAEFWFAGHGELNEAREQAVRLGISSKVRLLGWIAERELQAIYSQVDVFCLPSHNEGVPMSMLEAMSHTIPVVCTPVGGVPDVIVDGTNGLIVEPGSPGSVAAGIVRLFRDSELAGTIGRLGHKTVQETCGIDAVTTQMAAIYRDLAAPVAAVLIGANRAL
jgi:glycosyltransferase involved in cell wall biosynthesis